MAEELEELTEKEFRELSDSDKWNLIQTIKKIVQQLKVQADKNCAECEKTFLTPEDINIDLFFQDWRECSEHCDECGEEEKINMCQLQFDLMNHIANTLLEIQRKQNLLTQLVLKRDETGSKLLKEFVKKKEEIEKKEKSADDMYR